MEDYRNPALAPEKRAEDLLGRMTLREKVGQLNQRLYGFSCYEREGEHVKLTKEFCDEVEKWGGLGVLYGLYRADAWSGRSGHNGLEGRLAVQTYNRVQRYVVEHSRFGVPVLMSSECPHGHQALGGYLLPVALAMGATFNPQLVRSAFQVCGRQLKGMGVHLALISLLDILRDPRWGRSEECFSEDPFLASRLAGAAVRGCREGGADVVAKHFCAQGACTGGINAAPANIGRRELEEIFLPSMRECVKAGAAGCMAAYNEIDGVPCHANPELLGDILRGELGFRGLVMADGGAVDRLDCLTGGDKEKAGALALRAGVQISLWDEGFTLLEKAVGDGLVAESAVDEAAARVLGYKFRTGLFDRPYLDEKEEPEAFSYGRYDQSLELAKQSCVLLKNAESLLPLKSCRRLAVIGPDADSVYALCGDYTPPVKDGVTVLAGMRELSDARITYVKGCGVRGNIPNEIGAARQAAADADAVVLVLGGSSERVSKDHFDTNGALIAQGDVAADCGEGVDVAELGLGGLQNELADAVFSAGKPVITVIVAGRPYAVPVIARRTQALLWCFYPGPVGGRAVAQILLGEAAPSGRLPVSIPRSGGQIPVYYNYKSSVEGQRYVDMERTPLYRFGSGETYTTFIYELEKGCRAISRQDLRQGEEAGFTFSVANTGKADAYAVPQLYVHFRTGAVTRRIRELRGFQKIFLKAGRKEEVTLTLSADELTAVGRSGRMELQPGMVDVILSGEGKDRWRGELEITD